MKIDEADNARVSNLARLFRDENNEGYNVKNQSRYLSCRETIA